MTQYLRYDSRRTGVPLLWEMAGSRLLEENRRILAKPAEGFGRQSFVIE